MKKLLAIILCLAILFSMAACSSSGGEELPTEQENIGSDVSADNTESSSGSEQNSSGSSGGSGSSSGGSGSGSTSSGGDTPSSSGSSSTTDLGPKVLGLFYRDVVRNMPKSTDSTVLEIDKKADAMLKSIENYPDSIKASGTTYYVSNLGSDSNSGTSPEKAVKNYSAIRGKLKKGDAVLFRRGDVFRGKMQLVSGVSFGAYGSGIKPRFYGSVDGSKNGGGTWKTTDTKGVYVYSKIVKDYSNIVFNNGEAIGRPVQKMEDITERELNVVYKSGKVYLYSPKGNPQDLYDSIEIAEGYVLINGDGTNDNILVQNFCIMYAGLHGIGSIGNADNLEIEGCVIGYIGGKDLYTGGISIGNGIEVWASSNNLQVHDNYVFQCFDAGITHQSNSGVKQSVNEDNIHYKNNLVEYCVYSFEAFTAGNHGDNKEYNDRMGDVYIENNICRYAGWGWGYLDRPDKGAACDIKYRAGDHQEPLKISGNVFDRPKNGIAIMSTIAAKEFMIFTDNVIVQDSKRSFMSLAGGSANMGSNLETFMAKYFSNYSGNKITTLK